MPSFNNHWGENQDPLLSARNGQQVFGPEPAFRSGKDALLNGPSNVGTPYPDGYLNTSGANSRRQDRLNPAVYRRNYRSYERGIHAGTLTNPANYWWPEEFNKWTGVQKQLEGKKQAPAGMEPIVVNHNTKIGPRQVPNPLDRPVLQQIDPQRAALLRRDLPTWR